MAGLTCPLCRISFDAFVDIIILIGHGVKVLCSLHALILLDRGCEETSVACKIGTVKNGVKFFLPFLDINAYRVINFFGEHTCKSLSIWKCICLFWFCCKFFFYQKMLLVGLLI